MAEIDSKSLSCTKIPLAIYVTRVFLLYFFIAVVSSMPLQNMPVR